MSASNPPRLACWLLRHFGPSYCRESLLGDLLEAYSVRRSALWYWREVSGALWVSLREVFQNNLLPLACEMVTTWAVLMVCLWSVDTIARRWNPGDIAAAGGWLSAILHWAVWLLSLVVAHAAAGGVIGRVPLRHRCAVLLGLLVSVLDWRWPILGRLMLHMMAEAPDAGRIVQSVVEFSMAFVGVWVGLRLSKSLRNPQI